MAFDQSLGWKCPFLSKATFAYSLHWTSLHKCCELVRRCFVSLSADWDGKKSITKTCIMSSKRCLSGNIMHYGFALLVMVQGCSGGGISTRVTLSNGIIFKIFFLFYYRFSRLDLCRWFLKVARFPCIPHSHSQVGFWSTSCTGIKLWVDADMHLPVVRMNVYIMYVLACS